MSNQARQRLSRGRRFVLLAGVILAPLILIGVLLQIYFNNVVTRGAPYLAALEPDVLRSARVVVLGDSHVRDAVPSREQPPHVVNLAFGGDSLKEVYLKALYALEHAPELSCVVLQCDFHILSEYRLTSNNQFMTFYFAGSEDINRLYPGQTLNRAKQKLFLRVPILYGPNRAETVQLMIEDVRRTGIGWTRREDPPKTGDWSRVDQARRMSLARARVGRQYRSRGAEVSPALADLYSDLISLLRSRGIRVVCVRYPVTAEYLQALREEVNLAAIQDAFDLRPSDLQLDYSSAFTDHPELFDNQDHLNVAGGEMFAGALFQTLRESGCEEIGS